MKHRFNNIQSFITDVNLFREKPKIKYFIDEHNNKKKHTQENNIKDYFIYCGCVVVEVVQSRVQRTPPGGDV